MSGLSRTPGKRVGVNSPPRVRIPLSPPMAHRSDPLVCSARPDFDVSCARVANRHSPSTRRTRNQTDGAFGAGLDAQPAGTTVIWSIDESLTVAMRPRF